MAPKTAKLCAAPSEMVWALAGEKDAASSTETINATLHTAYELGRRALLAVLRSALLTRSKAFTDLQLKDRRMKIGANRALKDRHMGNICIYEE